jgi:hypothetical protein
MQRFARVPMLGINIDARLDIANEPCIEAEDLGRLLEYGRPRDCRDLVRRLLDAKRLSRTARSCTAPQNSADNSTVVQTNRSADVFAVEVIEQHGVRAGTTEQLWLTERAALLVATASDTERAWQVRTALVDFFVAYRKQGVVEVRAMLEEMRALRADIGAQLALDGRVRTLEQLSLDFRGRRSAGGAGGKAPATPSEPPQKRSAEDELVHAWAEMLQQTGRQGLTASEALRAAPDLERFGKGAHALSMRLVKARGRIVGEHQLTSTKDRNGVAVWRIESAT